MGSFKSGVETNKDTFPILPRIARADQSAVRECIDLYGNMVWALAKQFTASTAEAEKAVSEIFADIWENAAGCDLEISEEAVWIAVIARRRLSRYVFDESAEPKVEFSNDLLAGRTKNIQQNI